MNVIDNKLNKIPLHLYIFNHYMVNEVPTMNDDILFAHSLFFSCELMYPSPRVSEIDKVKKLAIEFKKHLPRPLRVQYVRDKFDKTKKPIKFDIFDVDRAVEAWIRTVSHWRDN